MSQSKAAFFRVDELEAQRAQSGKLYREFLRAPKVGVRRSIGKLGDIWRDVVLMERRSLTAGK